MNKKTKSNGKKSGSVAALEDSINSSQRLNQSETKAFINGDKEGMTGYTEHNEIGHDELDSQLKLIEK